MKQVYKYPLELTDSQLIKMPVDAELLTVQMQGPTPCLWAIVESTQREVALRRILIVGTGNGVPEGKYIATFQERQFVWHAFDCGES